MLNAYNDDQTLKARKKYDLRRRHRLLLSVNNWAFIA